MSHFEYKVVPAPSKGTKSADAKSPEARFANAIQDDLNELAAEGWEYLRAELLPSEERQGLTSTQTVYRSLLIFRRATAAGTAPKPIKTDTTTTTSVDPDDDWPDPKVDAAPKKPKTPLRATVEHTGDAPPVSLRAARTDD